MGKVTPDQAERVLIEAEAGIARLRSLQMEALMVIDSMQVPTADGSRSLREWTAARLDVSPETASSLTTTARRLADSPSLASRLASGDISFDRAEATSRIPDRHQTEWLQGLDIVGVRRAAARHRRLTAADDHHAHRSQHLVVQPNLDESSWNIWGVLDGYGGAVVDKVLTEEADFLAPLPDGEVPGIGYRRAVALLKICEERRPGDSGTPLITVFADELCIETEAGTMTGMGILDKIACTGALEIIQTKDGRPLSVGRSSRVIPPRLRRFVLHRDGSCTAEGCTSRYRLQPHHKIPWSQGGATDPENLTTLCWFHHHIVIHGWGFRIDDSRGPGRIRFTRPIGGHDPP